MRTRFYPGPCSCRPGRGKGAAGIFLLCFLFFSQALCADETLTLAVDLRLNRISGLDTLQDLLYERSFFESWTVRAGLALKVPEAESSILDGWFCGISYMPPFLEGLKSCLSFLTLTNNYSEYNRGDACIILSAGFNISRWFHAEVGGFVRFLNLAPGWYSLPLSPEMAFMAFGMRYTVSLTLSPEAWPVQLSGNIGNFEPFLQENLSTIIFSLRGTWKEDFGSCFVEVGARPSGILTLASTWYEVFAKAGLRVAL